MHEGHRLWKSAATHAAGSRKNGPACPATPARLLLTAPFPTGRRAQFPAAALWLTSRTQRGQATTSGSGAPCDTAKGSAYGTRTQKNKSRVSRHAALEARPGLPVFHLVVEFSLSHGAFSTAAQAVEENLSIRPQKTDHLLRREALHPEQRRRNLIQTVGHRRFSLSCQGAPARPHPAP